jgi:hypothetical protein
VGERVLVHVGGSAEEARLVQNERLAVTGSLEMRFIERSVEDGQEVVVLRYAAVFYWLMWPTLAITMIAGITTFPFATAITVAAWAALLASAAPYWMLVFELKRRMRESAITASGSKYSFVNPLTYRWQVDEISNCPTTSP